MEEKNCWDRFPQVVLLSLSAFFFLQHCSIDSLEELFLPADAAERTTRKAAASITDAITIRMIFLFRMLISSI